MSTVAWERPAFDASRELRSALRHSGKPATLQRHALASLAAVQLQAGKRHAGHPLAEGLALRDLLRETVRAVDDELVATADPLRPLETLRLRLVLRGLARGDGIATSGRALGLADGSHATRMLYRVQHLLVRHFLQRVGQFQPATEGAPAARALPSYRGATRMPRAAHAQSVAPCW